LTRADIPDTDVRTRDVSSVFNPGAVRYRDRDLLLLRVQNRGRESLILVAESRDGVEFTVRPGVVELRGLEQVDAPIHHVYDPRITELDGSWYITVAMDMDDACRMGLAVTEDFEDFRFLGFISDDDSRNGVLFPERVGGRYLMLERPNLSQLEGGPTSGETVVLSASSDLRQFDRVGPVFSGRPRYWDERIGSGPPPVKTRRGWLHLYHGVATHFASANIYQAGAVLLDLDDPSRVIARTRFNILEPREVWELAGQVPNVVFPGGMIVDAFDDEGFALPDSEVRVYYGAADTVVGLATATIAELIADCYDGLDGTPGVAR